MSRFPTPGVEELPGQIVQVSLLQTRLYVPASHMSQASPVGVKPASETNGLKRLGSGVEHGFTTILWLMVRGLIGFRFWGCGSGVDTAKTGQGRGAESRRGRTSGFESALTWNPPLHTQSELRGVLASAYPRSVPGIARQHNRVGLYPARELEFAVHASHVNDVAAATTWPHTEL
eukprot:2225183-Rhodomonas_salina.3